jgi:thiol-disulfide isomerase/thioredoxin
MFLPVMKKVFAILLLSVGLAATTQAQYSNETIKLGQKAPELAFANPAGQTIKLSDLNKNRIVLVDFWASWCRPCRIANPKLVALYHKYKTQKFKNAKDGFTILSVSLDQNKDAWVNAISKDNLNWENHISDLGGWQSRPAEIYGVQFVPQAFLVDQNGTIIGKYMTAEEAEADLQKLVKK